MPSAFRCRLFLVESSIALILAFSAYATSASPARLNPLQSQRPTAASSSSEPSSYSAQAAPAAATADDIKRPSLPPGVDPKTGQPLYLTIQEDWSSLAIGTSKLTPEPPLLAQTDEGDNFTRTLVQLKWRPGDPLDLYLVLPKGVKKPAAVLYLYGYKEDTDRFRDNGWCARATRGGVAAVGFVSALSGPRFQSRPLEQWFVSELQESLGSTVHDVHFILDYLTQRGEVDMERIGMFGQASGATIALLSAAADPRIKAVDALDPWGDWPEWLAHSPVVLDDEKHADFVTPQFLAKVAPLDPVKWLPTLTTTRVRIQQVMANEATPNACKDALQKAAPKQADIVRFKNLGELSSASGGGKLFDWIKGELKTLPAPAVGQAVVTQERPRGSEDKEQSRDH